ncbi:transcriptional regulator with MHYT and LytTR domains (plasmid) [Afipia carboxidovorans OM5]|uniref:Transcriptional regulator with MHYT and LytTR domains n=1 Tax=Afipia carboxidovorans (strain ATCC 49405 / DSM 1227 / KCTC 32145 / OM5) TaxID=504832 RepID=Q9KX27_AFIC5|nr:MHYT domain-containing protein [Afipia carboxidovorans]AEI04475.1 transcriptional regulator with MHYT and LytTR domains [Afipia carboxidovorans OM4]AEI08103.1 transcriptional regulator with MHYT and LytTR domains [Afipia carboxidovorans OM5]
MPITHDPMLVALSLLVAIQASYVGLNLSLRVSQAFALHRRLLIAGAALSFAVGIWAMHFVGMLAARLPVTVDYVVLPTLLSLLVCVLVVGIAVYLATQRSQRLLFVAATVMGVGIISMHYIGMMALHASAHMTHDPLYVIASVLIAILASGWALWLAFASETRPSLFVCATVLGCAIAGMHYTAMAGLTLHPIAGVPPSAVPAISSGLLALIVSVVAFLVSGFFMLALVPDQTEYPADALILPESSASTPVSEAVALGEPILAVAPAAESAITPGELTRTPSARIYESTLPVEKYHGSKVINTADIFSVHANAHYTYVFNGREDIFCPLSIGEIIERLPPDTFFRVHRSYIINIHCVARLKRAGDNGIAELDSPVRRSVPVSRSRLPQLREQLAAYLGTKGS